MSHYKASPPPAVPSRCGQVSALRELRDENSTRCKEEQTQGKIDSYRRRLRLCLEHSPCNREDEQSRVVGAVVHRQQADNGQSAESKERVRARVATGCTEQPNDPKTYTNVLLGFQAIAFAVFTKLFAISEGLLPADPLFDKLFRYITLEVGLLAGSLMILLGLGTSIYAVGFWEARHFGALDYPHTMRIVIPAALFLTLGVQTVFSSFFLRLLGLRRR